MASLLDGIDLTNPCLVWPKLQEAYYRLMAGEGVVRSRFDREEAEFTAVQAPALLEAISRLKAECERSQGRRARQALRAGFRDRRY